MGCGASQFHYNERKYKLVAIKPISIDDDSSLNKTKEKEDESCFTATNTLPSLQRSSSFLFDPSAKLDNLLPDLKEMGNILHEEKVAHLFYRYLKESNWMDEILQQIDVSAERSKKNVLSRNNTNKRISVMFHSYCLLSAQENRSYLQQDEMESQAMYLLHHLKNQEAQEESEREGKLKLIFDSFSNEEIASILAAMGLRSFLLSSEYKKMVSCNWTMDVSAIKFKRNEATRSGNNLRKFQNNSKAVPSYGMRKAGSIPMILSAFEDDPMKQHKQFIGDMLSRVNFQTFQSIFNREQSWLSPFAQAIHRIPIALSIVNHDAVYGNWNVEYITPHYSSVTGFPVEDVVGNDMSSLYWENGDPDHKSNIRFALRNKETYKVALHNRRKNGEIFVDLMALQPIFEHDITVSTSHQNSFRYTHPPSPTVKMANAAVAAVGAAVTSTSAFFSTSSQSLTATFPADAQEANACGELEDYHSPTVSPKASASPTPRALALMKTASVQGITTPSYQKVHRLYALRKCRRFIVVHTDLDNRQYPSKISDLKHVEDLLLLLRFIL